MERNRIKLVLTDETQQHNKFDDGCGLCSPSRAMMRRLACVTFNVTKATLYGGLISRDAWVCDDCIADCEKDELIEVVQ